MMFVLTLIVSRLVPIMFLASFFMIFSRFLYDRYLPQNRVLARTFLIVVLTLGLIVVAPYMMRAACVTAAEVYFLRNDWAKADSYFSLHSDLNGKLSGTLARDWVDALMATRNWQKAEAVILSSFKFSGNKVRADPQSVLLLGMCRYYDGQLDLAWRTFLNVSDVAQSKYLTEYFMGRIAEYRNDPSTAAEKYLAALQAAPRFLPALYQAVRINLALGRRTEAAKILGTFSTGNDVRDSSIQLCVSAVHKNGPPPPPKEFLLVHIPH